MPHRLLMTGDLHIGRVSSRLPSASLASARTAAAWMRLVDLARTEKVSAVLLSGDVVDDCNRFWEATGALESGIQRLSAVGIPVLAVAGNHDHAVLNRLASSYPRESFALLGAGGVWERYTLREPDGCPWLHVDGWSFPRASVRTSPLLDYPFSGTGTAPVLGLVHGDPGVSNSVYAPLDLLRLRALPPQAWLLGHIHAPYLEAPENRAWILMPGSPQAMDPGETGCHGPWMAQVSGMRITNPEQIPLSTVWYATLAVDVAGVEDVAALEDLLLGRLRDHGATVEAQAGDALEHVRVRLHLTGASSLSSRIPRIADALREKLSLPVGHGSLTVDAVRVDTTPALDLETLSHGNNVVSVLAQLLQALENGRLAENEVSLLNAVRPVVERTENAREFQALPRRSLADDALRSMLAHPVRALLSQLSEDAT